MNNSSDDKLKDIFTNFNPETTDSDDFVMKLQTKLDAIDVIKEDTHKQQTRTRRAVVAAAVAGFISGVIFSLTIPYLGAFLTGKTIVIAWVIVAAASLTIAYNTYTLALAKIKI